MTRVETPLPVETALPGPLTREEVRGLLEPAPGALYLDLPAHGARRGGDAAEPDPLEEPAARRRGAARRARPAPKPEIEQLLEPLRALQDDADFWQHQSEGLAAFRAPDLVRVYRLPLRFDELAAVEDRFHLKPVFPLFDGDGRFFVLAIAMHDIRLFEGSRWSVEEVDLEGRAAQHRGGGGRGAGAEAARLRPDRPGRAGGRTARPPSTATAPARTTPRPLSSSFFKRVDNGIQELPIDRNAPLVLAGVDYLLPIYREATQHPHLVRRGRPRQPRGPASGGAARRRLEAGRAALPASGGGALRSATAS